MQDNPQHIACQGMEEDSAFVDGDYIQENTLAGMVKLRRHDRSEVMNKDSVSVSVSASVSLLPCCSKAGIMPSSFLLM
jgi:hypothetical protein